MEATANTAVTPGNLPSDHLFPALESLGKDNKLTTDEVVSLYPKYADRYDQHMGDLNYMAADLTARYVHKHAQRFKLGKDCSIVDIAAGTGLAAERLKELYGYTTVDGLDQCAEMIQKAQDKGIYRRTYTGKVGHGQRLPMDDESYEVAMVSAALAPGHLPYDAFLEILRVVKPGGLVVNTMREEFTWNSPECDVRVPFGRWQEEGLWSLVEWAIPDNKYFGDKDALVHVYRKNNHNK